MSNYIAASRTMILALTTAAATLIAQAVNARDNPWSLSLYAGPSSTQFVSQILSGNFDVNGAMIGAALDRNLISLGSGISFAGEVQATQVFGKYTYGCGAVGIGFRFDEFPWRASLPTSLAIYSGPSYASDMPEIGYPKLQPAHRFLNYVGLEAAFGFSPHWDATLRVFHRSGAWGLYSSTADVGSMIGLGFRYRF